MIAIPNFSPKDGLYQIDKGRIHKYKGKGGTVRVYDLIEIDDTVWENEKYKLIRMTNEARINKAMAERRADEHTDKGNRYAE